jgi:hypothetical protein
MMAFHDCREDLSQPHLDQLQPFQARVPVAPDDDLVVHGDAERGGAMLTIAFVIWTSACER